MQRKNKLDTWSMEKRCFLPWDRGCDRKWSKIAYLQEIRWEICSTLGLSRRTQAYPSDILGLRNIQGCWGSIPISGIIDSWKYIEILENYIKHSIFRYFGEDAIIFRQDNAPCYVFRVIWEYLEENDICKMEWTAQSPVLNILENIWLSIKRKIDSDAGEIKRKEDLIERFRFVWNETTQLEIEKLYAFLPSHCKDFIFKNGHMSKF